MIEIVKVSLILKDRCPRISSRSMGAQEMNVLCRHCNAKHFQSEKINTEDSFNDCGGHGSANY